MALCEHANTASDDAVLCSIRDRSVMEALVENGGYQEVVGVFSRNEASRPPAQIRRSSRRKARAAMRLAGW
jgi:hypothetical protein